MLSEDENQFNTQRESAPRLGYETAVHLVSLVSQELYSRFNVMLTIHGLLLTAIGLIFTQGERTILEHILLLLLTLSGAILCWIWRGFVTHGVKAQELFRSEARHLEELYFDRSVHLFSRLHGDIEDSETQSGSRPPSFERSAGRVIWLFQILYVTLSVLFVVRAIGVL